MFLAVSARFNNFVEMLAGGKFYIFILRLFFLELVWWFGIWFHQRKKSRVLSVFLWFWGIISIAYAAFFVWIFFTYTMLGNGFGGLAWTFAGICSVFTLIPCYLILMCKTVAATTNRPGKPLAVAKLAIGSSLVTIFLLIIMSIIS